MVYATARGITILFGGTDGAQQLDETWSWDGTTWSPVVVATRPSKRVSHALAYDEARDVVVLFGGNNAALNDTWELTAAGWAQASPTISAPARLGAAMTYDAKRRRILLYGGTNTGGGPGLSDLWEWDGIVWVDRTPATRPPPRYGTSIVYDPGRDRTVLHGGYDGANARSDTWEWDGGTGTWAQRVPAHTVGACAGHQMIYDPARQVVVLWGGCSNKTWIWDGNDWTEVSLSTAPSERDGFGMVYDLARGGGLVFGGFDRAIARAVGDSWTY